MSVNQTIAERAATITTYTAGGGAVVFGLTANEFAAIVGALLALLGFVVNLWFRWQHLNVIRKTVIEHPECAVCPEREV